MKSVLILIAVTLAHVCVSPVKAQTGAGFGMEMNLMGGKVLKHTSKFKAPVPSLSTAIELNFVQQTSGSKEWQQRRRFPLAGFGITYTDYGIDSVYGKCISIYPNLQIPIIRGRNLEWTAKVGFGLGYVTKHYERAPVWDTLNNAIGSHLNNYTILSSDLRYHIDSKVDIQAGLHFSHISNASIRVPNLGVNFYGFHIGMRYFPKGSSPERKYRNLTPLPGRWLAQARIGIAGNEFGWADGPVFPVYLLSAYASKRYHSKNKLLFGVDYSYHKGIEAFLKNNEIFQGEEKAHSWKSSVFAGNEFLVGRVGILIQVGYYIHEAALKLDPYYEKLGGNFYFIQNEHGTLKEACLSIILKTHKTQAELAELGLGLGF